MRSAALIVLSSDATFWESWPWRVLSWASSDWRVCSAACKAACCDVSGPSAADDCVIWFCRVIRRVDDSVCRICCFSGLGGIAGVGRFAFVVGRAISKGESSMRFGCGVLGFGG